MRRRWNQMGVLFIDVDNAIPRKRPHGNHGSLGALDVRPGPIVAYNCESVCSTAQYGDLGC